jgi:hypothetical protein
LEFWSSGAETAGAGATPYATRERVAGADPEQQLDRWKVGLVVGWRCLRSGAVRGQETRAQRRMTEGGGGQHENDRDLPPFGGIPPDGGTSTPLRFAQDDSRKGGDPKESPKLMCRAAPRLRPPEPDRARSGDRRTAKSLSQNPQNRLGGALQTATTASRDARATIGGETARTRHIRQVPSFDGIPPEGGTQCRLRASLQRFWDRLLMQTSPVRFDPSLRLLVIGATLFHQSPESWGMVVLPGMGQFVQNNVIPYEFRHLNQSPI